MTATVRNPAREKLEQGQLSLEVGIRMTRSVEIAKAMAVSGFDWLFLDMEHGVMSLEACAQISAAALDAGIAPIARVRTANTRSRPAPSTTARSALSCRMSIPPPKRARWSTGSNTRRSGTARWAGSGRITGCVRSRPARRRRRSTRPT